MCANTKKIDLPHFRHSTLRQAVAVEPWIAFFRRTKWGAHRQQAIRANALIKDCAPTPTANLAPMGARPWGGAVAAFMRAIGVRCNFNR